MRIQSRGFVIAPDHCRTRPLDVSKCACNDKNQSCRLLQRIEGEHTESGEYLLQDGPLMSLRGSTGSRLVAESK